jgi:DNA-binding transcriptional ArsR family regulator
MSATAKNLAPVIHGLMPLDHLKNAAECLKCAAHPHRLRIIEILFQGKFTVDDIANLCELSQPATSGHLRLMEAKGLLKSERFGRTVYYSVAEPHLKGIIGCIRNRFQDHQQPD